MSALAPGEQTVMVRFYLGVSAAEISRQTGMHQDRVSLIIAHFAENPRRDHDRDEAIRRKTCRGGHR